MQPTPGVWIKELLLSHRLLLTVSASEEDGGQGSHRKRAGGI